MQGQSDVPLSALGERQAEALRARFAGEAVVLYSSPLSRARTTAALAFPGQTPILEPRLSELNFGSFEGLTLAERCKLPAWHTWTEPFDMPAPGGESYGALQRRAVAWLESLPDAAAPDTRHIVAVTHSGTIQTLLAHILQMETRSWRKRVQPSHTGVTSFVRRGPELLLECFNDTHHLSPKLQTVPPALPEIVRP